MKFANKIIKFSILIVRKLAAIAFLVSIPVLAEPMMGGGFNFEFSSDMQDYFAEELALPSSPALGQMPLFKEKADVYVSVSPLEYGWRLIFTFPQPVLYRETMEDGIIYFEFNQRVDTPELLPIQEKLSYLIKQFSNGFNSISFSPKQPLEFGADVQDNLFILDLFPAYEVPYEGTRLLKLAKLRLLIEQRRYQAAFSYISRLEEEYPDDKDILLLNASLEALLPRWQEEMILLTELTNEYPEDEDIIRLSNEAYSPHAPYIQALRQIQRTVGLAVYQVYGLQAETILDYDCEKIDYAGVQWQLYSGHIGQIVNSKGQFVCFRGVRNQVTLYKRKEWVSGSYLTGLIYGQTTALGAGLEMGRLVPKIQGQINLFAYVHRPYWGVFEGLAYFGREDLLRVEVNSVYNRYFNWRFGLGGHRVGIQGTPNGFSSVLVSGEMFYNLIVGNLTIALNYGLDAEYITQQKTKIGIDGNRYHPVPYQSFENHSFRCYVYYTWRERWNVMAFAGETFNRIGLNARTYGINLKYAKPVPCGWEFELSAYRFPSTVVQGATGEYFTAMLTKRF